ncbi:MAG TPA: hypothetical protein P5514_09605 [Bacteroidales bacterium]|nr:hypothetical protein [Bacteroidales bacterium]HPE57899.1 hypothetical protein [Bacteroidales bacterium]HRX97186.1 hypothetical protein [Bacteroidales bacterium]
MKKLLRLLVLMMLISSFTFAQDDESATDYKMYETMYLKPKTDKMMELGEALAKHNRTYHKDDPYKVHIWMANTGPHTGELVYVMGPCTFTDLDSRPDSEEHTEDWIKNVMPYVKEVSDGEYWKMDDKLSYSPDGSFTGKEIWSVYDIKPFDSYRFKALLEKVVEVYKQKEYPNYFEVYFNQFDSDNGRDVAIGFGFPNYAFFDEDDTFWKDYEDVHGEGSRWKFFEEFRDIVNNSYDELSEYIPELSSE